MAAIMNRIARRKKAELLVALDEGSGGEGRVIHDAMADFEASLALGFTFGR